MSSKRKRPALAGEGNWEQLAEDLYGVDFQKNQLGEVVDLAAADLIDEDLMKEVLAEVAPAEAAEPPSTPNEDAGTETPKDATAAPAADENIQIVWDEAAVTEKSVVEESVVEQVVEQDVETAPVEPVVVDEDAGQSEIVASETADEVSVVFDSEDDNSVAVTEFAAIEPDQAAEVDFADVTEEIASVDVEEPDLSGDELNGSDDEIEDGLADEKSASSDDGYWEALEDFDWGDSRTRDKPTSDVKPNETKPAPSSSVKAPIETRKSPIVSKDDFIDDDSFGVGALEADFGSDKDFDFGDSETLEVPVEKAPSMETEAAVESVTSTSESSTSESSSTEESSTEESTGQPRKRRRRRRRRRKPATAETNQDESQDSVPVEDDVQPAAEVAEPVEEQQATLNDSTETESDSDDGTEKKVRRRSRSRRRRRKSSEASTSTEPEELDDDSDIVDPVDDIDDNPDKETDSKQIEKSFQDLPTWEEAIVYLLDPSLVGKNQGSETSGHSSKGDASKGSKSSGRRGRRRR